MIYSTDYFHINISIVQIHPKGWCVLSRNTDTTETSEVSTSVYYLSEHEQFSFHEAVRS